MFRWANKFYNELIIEPILNLDNIKRKLSQMYDMAFLNRSLSIKGVKVYLLVVIYFFDFARISRILNLKLDGKKLEYKLKTPFDGVLLASSSHNWGGIRESNP